MTSCNKFFTSLITIVCFDGLGCGNHTGTCRTARIEDVFVVDEFVVFGTGSGAD